MTFSKVRALRQRVFVYWRFGLKVRPRSKCTPMNMTLSGDIVDMSETGERLQSIAKMVEIGMGINEGM